MYIQNLQIFQTYIFCMLQHFTTKLKQPKDIFYAVVMNFTISICLKILLTMPWNATTNSMQNLLPFDKIHFLIKSVLLHNDRPLHRPARLEFIFCESSVFISGEQNSSRASAFSLYPIIHQKHSISKICYNFTLK